MVHRHSFSILLTAVLFLAAAVCTAGQDAGPPGETDAADPLLREARDLASEGKLKDAAAAYSQWLAENAGHASFGIILIEAADSQVSVERALELLRVYTPRIRDPGQREICRASQIDLLEMLGRTEQALSLLRSFPPTPHWLYRQAQLLYRQGLTEEAENSLGQALRALLSAETADSGYRAGDGAGSEAADGGHATGAFTQDPRELEARIRLLQARIYLLEGKNEEAENLFRFLSARYGVTAAAPGILLAYYEFLAAQGREAEAAVQLNKLAEDFPHSPELALIREEEGEEKIGYAPSPSRMLPRELPPPGSSSSSPDLEPGSSDAAKPGSRSGESRDSGQQTHPAVAPEAQPAAPPDPGPQPHAGPATPPEPESRPVTKPQSQQETRPETEPASPQSQQETRPMIQSEQVPQPAIQSQSVLVQTGSFRDRENAQYMVRDLAASGFEAGIVEKQIGGTLYYRVVIGPQMTLEEAQLVLMRLKDASFEGVLLFPE